VIVDTSAIIAILRGEPDADYFAEAISAEQGRTALSAASYLETAIVVDGARSPISSRRLDEFLAEAGIKIVEVTPGQARIARAAYRDFGKGSGHPAQLNFGDCFAYALATERGERLLAKGNDFVRTDVRMWSSDGNPRG
jgi:ribonuclease VapC